MVLRRNKDFSERMKGGQNEFEGQKIKHNAGGLCNPGLAGIQRVAPSALNQAYASDCYTPYSAARPPKLGRDDTHRERPPLRGQPKSVVDSALKSDAEILAYLAGAASGRTCGRFVAGQLERPLQRAAPAAPTRRRTWPTGPLRRS